MNVSQKHEAICVCSAEIKRGRSRERSICWNVRRPDISSIADDGVAARPLARDMDLADSDLEWSSCARVGDVDLGQWVSR